MQIRPVLALALAAGLAAPLAAHAALPGPAPDPTVPAARDTEAVVLHGSDFPGWAVPGNVTARGYDAAGHLVASDKVETVGAPAALRLTTDRTRLNADGEDVTMVTVAVVDAQGRVIPTADTAVHFDVSGAGYVAGVGNGNPSDHDPDKSSDRHAFNGLCMVVVGAKSTAGEMRLTASALGLKSAELALHTK